jgi:hypothetical protein
MSWMGTSLDVRCFTGACRGGFQSGCPRGANRAPNVIVCDPRDVDRGRRQRVDGSDAFMASNGTVFTVRIRPDFGEDLGPGNITVVYTGERIPVPEGAPRPRSPRRPDPLTEVALAESPAGRGGRVRAGERAHGHTRITRWLKRA